MNTNVINSNDLRIAGVIIQSYQRKITKWAEKNGEVPPIWGLTTPEYNLLRSCVGNKKDPIYTNIIVDNQVTSMILGRIN